MRPATTFFALVFLTFLGAPTRGFAEEPLIRSATGNPDRRASLEDWWQRFEAAQPALALTAHRLREAKTRWRNDPNHKGCQRALEAFERVDRDGLLRGAEYLVAVELSSALDEFEGAAAACLERRYFEFEYRLWMAESGVRRLSERVSARLALEHRRFSEGRGSR